MVPWIRAGSEDRKRVGAGWRIHGRNWRQLKIDFSRVVGFLITVVYFPTMNDPGEHSVHLTVLREQAGLTVRELARQLGTSHPNILA